MTILPSDIRVYCKAPLSVTNVSWISTEVLCASQLTEPLWCKLMFVRMLVCPVLTFYIVFCDWHYSAIPLFSVIVITVRFCKELLLPSLEPVATQCLCKMAFSMINFGCPVTQSWILQSSVQTMLKTIQLSFYVNTNATGHAVIKCLVSQLQYDSTKKYFAIHKELQVLLLGSIYHIYQLVDTLGLER